VPSCLGQGGKRAATSEGLSLKCFIETPPLWVQTVEAMLLLTKDEAGFMLLLGVAGITAVIAALITIAYVITSILTWV